MLFWIYAISYVKLAALTLIMDQDFALHMYCIHLHHTKQTPLFGDPYFGSCILLALAFPEKGSV